MPKASPQIICFHPGALGDLINTLPALAALCRRWPHARLTCLGQLEIMELLKETGLIHQAFSLDFPGLHTLFHPDLEPPQSLALFLKQFDLAVSWMRGPANIFPQRLQSLGLRTAYLPGPFPPPPGSGPASRYYAEPVRQLGLDLDSEHPRLELSPALRAQWLSARPNLVFCQAIIEEPWVGADPCVCPIDGAHGGAPLRFLPRKSLDKALVNSQYLVIHPGSGSPAKNWPAEKFAALARELSARLHLRVVVVQGPADESAVKKMVEAGRGIPVQTLSGLTLKELAAVLAGAELMVGNDSGVSHLAGAMGTPTVAVFVSSDPGVWGVNQSSARNISPDQANLQTILAAIAELLTCSGGASPNS